MKSTLRYFALFVVVAGCTAALIAPKNTPIVPNHLAATAKMPVPICPRACTLPD